MGKVIIYEDTTKYPYTTIGKYSGVCWDAPIDDNKKNYNRGKKCLKSGHMRTAEYVTVYLTLEGYSARVIREFYTHIGGAPTRTQASTRYIDYSKGFDYITPISIARDEYATVKWKALMNHINKELNELEEYGIPVEDIANGLPLGMTTKVVVRTNLRQLINMINTRLCNRAYWEFRQMVRDIMKALYEYSDEWAEIATEYFKCICDVTGYCIEEKSCGKKPKKEEIFEIIKNL